MQKYLYVLLLLAVVTNSMAQAVIAVGGGSIQSSDGATDFSVGQVFYNIGNPAEGVIQVITNESEVALGNSELAELRLSVYPNPFQESIRIDIDKKSIVELSYDVFSVDGKSIASGSINQDRSVISLKEWPDAIYKLRVYSRSEIRTFTIIKKSK